MAIVLFLEKRKLPVKVKALFLKAEKGEIEILISAISLAEIAYLSEKKRIDTNLASATHFFSIYSSFQIVELSEGDISAAFLIDDIPELHDRLIAGTAHKMQIPIITNDPKIITSIHTKTIWE